jgi:hypothetical protein
VYQLNWYLTVDCIIRSDETDDMSIHDTQLDIGESSPV